MRKIKVQDAVGMELCHDITEMPDKVFPKSDEFARVSRIVFAALGIGTFPGEGEDGDENGVDSEIEDAKN